MFHPQKNDAIVLLRYGTSFYHPYPLTRFKPIRHAAFSSPYTLFLTECVIGRWGHDCLQECGNCQNNTGCDRDTGECPTGFPRCAEGYSGEACTAGTCCITTVMHVHDASIYQRTNWEFRSRTEYYKHIYTESSRISSFYALICYMFKETVCYRFDE